MLNSQAKVNFYKRMREDPLVISPLYLHHQFNYRFIISIRFLLRPENR